MTPKPEVHPLAAQIDELGGIDERLAPFRALIAREESLRKRIREFYAEDATPGEIHAPGTNYTAILGERGNQTVIDFARLVKAIKPAKFAKFAMCTLRALNANVDGETVAACTSLERTGPRGLKVFARKSASFDTTPWTNYPETAK